MNIRQLKKEEKELIQQAAEAIVAAFADSHPDAWPTLKDGFEEVEDCLDPEMVLLVALDDAGKLLGWIGGREEYDFAWELHPLVVDPATQRQGVGRALVAELEKRVKAAGANTIYLGSDDVTGQTSLSGVDLYPDPFDHVRNIKNLRNHPFEFYQKCGYVITGVVPDANGPGKPDIMMAKRIQ